MKEENKANSNTNEEVYSADTKVAVIYGAMHRGSTYNCVKSLLCELGKGNRNLSIKEYFLPKDMPEFCTS